MIRLTRWTYRLQQFNFQVHHRKGCLNLGPDALSRACESLEGEDAHCLAITTPKCSSDIPHWTKSLKHKVVTVLFLTLSQSSKTGRYKTNRLPSMSTSWVPVQNNGDKFRTLISQALISVFLHYFYDNLLGGHLG